MLNNEQEQLLDAYHRQFGVTFGYWAIASDNDKVKLMLVLIQEALDGKRDKVVDADLGIGTPGDNVLI
jgi:hypothetical protein